MPTFASRPGHLHYSERGDPGGPPVVLLHGLLWSARMFERVAGLLPGYRVLLLDLHGHGRSSTPTDPRRYRWTAMVDDVIALLDHLGVDRAAVGGLSLGANVTLATAVAHPERLAAMIIEMPVLTRGHPTARFAFGNLVRVYRASGPILGPVARLMGRLPLPRRVPELVAARDVAAAEPRVASAILQGLLADDPVPEDDATLRRLDLPALVIGHRKDPLHVLDDARDLARRLPRARFVEASSILEFRLHPDRLAGHLRPFLAEALTSPRA